MRKMLSAMLLMGMAAAAQNTINMRPQFQDFLVKKVFKGKSSEPKLTNADQRKFQSAIRTGAAKPVEFAGHYTVPQWGCGTSCTQFVIVDATNGHVFSPEFKVLAGLPGAWLQEHHDAPERMVFHPESRLLEINGCPNEKDCGFYDYEMVDDDGLRLVRLELLAPQYQP